MLSMLDPTRPEPRAATDAIKSWCDADTYARNLRACVAKGMWYVTALQSLVTVGMGYGETYEEAYRSLATDMRRHGVL